MTVVANFYLGHKMFVNRFVDTFSKYDMIFHFQYYVEFGGERYVDLGLGSHRVKCKVNKKFRYMNF